MNSTKKSLRSMYNLNTVNLRGVYTHLNYAEASKPPDVDPKLINVVFFHPIHDRPSRPEAGI